MKTTMVNALNMQGFASKYLHIQSKKTYIWYYEYRSKKFPHRFRIEQPGQ